MTKPTPAALAQARKIVRTCNGFQGGITHPKTYYGACIDYIALALTERARAMNIPMDAAAHILCGPDYAQVNEIALRKLDFGRQELKQALAAFP